MLIHGDTTTTLGGSLSAFYKQIPVGHVEAGLRTGDIYHPFPEEMNRRLSDALATLYFSPTTESKRHLISENLPQDRIFITGNSVIDALYEVVKRVRKPKSHELQKVLKVLAEGEVSEIITRGNVLQIIKLIKKEDGGLKPFEEVRQNIYETLYKQEVEKRYAAWIKNLR